MSNTTTDPWLAELGLDVRVNRDPFDKGWDYFAGLALRHNPKRAHLIVSQILGKHIPAAPTRIVEGGTCLASLVERQLGDWGYDAKESIVLGFAETATCLGHIVAASMNSDRYAHSTRDLRSGMSSCLSFEEGHSHAMSHEVLTLGTFFDSLEPLILVDDELTTGRTVVSTIEALQGIAPRKHYIVATLLDLRNDVDRLTLDDFAHSLGIEIVVCAALEAQVLWPHDVLDRAAQILTRTASADTPSETGISIESYSGVWPQDARSIGRHGWSRSDEFAAQKAAVKLAEAVQLRLRGNQILVLGTEELMYVPFLVASNISGEILFQSTTRSPVAVLESADYAIQSGLSFPSTDDPNRMAYVYNAKLSSYSDIVLISSDPHDGGDPTPMVDAISRGNPNSVIHDVRLPFDFYASTTLGE
jgi:hypothetical protein